MVRKLAAAMLGVGVLIPGLANALGLGEIKLNSALSEPLDAEIELVQVRELSAPEILPSLASSEDFDAAHVERFHYLTDLKFEVVIKPNGKSVIKVRSRKPIKEPFVNFLVEVNWPAGRLLREYTLLLDPPLYSQQPAAPVAAAKTTTAPKAAATTAPASTTSAPVASQPAYSNGDYAQETVQGGEVVESYTVGSNDSLWSIAKSMRPSDQVSIQQTMIAIQRKNPDAFIDGNINLMKKGAVLRAPSEDEVLALSNQDAMAMANEQNRQWRERTGTAAETEARQIDLTGRSVDREQEASGAGSTDRLKLVSAGASSAGSGQGGSSETGQLRNQLVEAEEDVDRFKLENDELRSRMVDLEDQLETSEKVLTLKDEQIAALQAKLRELEAQQKDAEAAAAAAAAAAAEVPAEVEPEQEATAAVPAEEQVTPAELVAPEATDDQAVDYNYQQEIEEQEASMAAEQEAESTDAGTAVDESAETAPEEAATAGTESEVTEEPVAEAPVAETESQPVAPAQQPAPAAQDDMITQIINNPVYLAAGGGVILLLIVLGLVAARRRQAAELDDDELEEEFDLIEAPEDDHIAELDSINLEDDDAFEEAVEASASEETVAQTTDVIGEADIYIAYGRFPQAIEMLEKAADNEPNRSDIRLKLCEVCVEAKEPAVFMSHFQVLENIGTQEEINKAQKLQDQMGWGQAEEPPVSSAPMLDDDTDDNTMLADSAVESFDFDSLDLPAEEPTNKVADESDGGLDFDFSELESSNDFANLETPAAAPASSDGEVAGLDFDLNFSLDETAETESDDATVMNDASSMDFDLDSSFITPEAKPVEPPVASSSDEASLDFDADFSFDDLSSSTSVEPKVETTEESSLDFNLDFDSSTTDLDDATVLDFEQAPSLDLPAETTDSGELNTQSAADLASELDLDLDSGFLDVPAEAPSLDITDLTPPPAAPMTSAANDMSDSGDDLDFLSDADEASTKLDLARAYIDMGDRDGAKDILDEVMIEGNDNQKSEAKELLTRLES